MDMPGLIKDNLDLHLLLSPVMHAIVMMGWQ